MDRLSAFCTVDIPTTTLDYLLECSEEYLEEFRQPNETNDVSNYLVIIDTKDISTITQGSSPPVTSCPTVFFDYTLEQVHAWFDANITQPRPKYLMPHCFLVLDGRSIQDNSCIFVCTQDSAPGQIESLRCTFDIALQNAVNCYFGQAITEADMGLFLRSKVTMTKANVELAGSRGLYMEHGLGEVKVDQYWKDFSVKWSES